MFGWFSKEKTQNWRKELKTQGNNSKLKEKTQNSRKKLSFPAFPKTMNGRKVHKQKAWAKTSPIYPNLDLSQPRGCWRVLGGRTPAGTIRDWCWSKKEPYEPKKFQLDSLEAARGFWGGWTPAGTIRDWRWDQKELFEPKKNLALVSLWRPWGHWRVLKGPDTSRDHQGLTLRSKGTVWSKKILALAGLKAAGGS